MRRAIGYVLAALAGVLAAWTLVSAITYVNRVYSGRDISQCVGLGHLGWLGPLLIVVIVGALATFLGLWGCGRRTNESETSEPRCVVCGHTISTSWKICPNCGSLAGRTRHPGA